MPRAHRSCLVAALALAAVLAPARTEACKCAHPKATPRAELAEADLVVQARVDSHVFTMERGFVTELTVARIHKGTPATRLVLAASKTCAASFEPGGSYLVYAWGDGDGGYSTTYCTRTAPLADAAEDLRVLGRGTRPAVSPMPPSWIAIGDAIAAVLSSLARDVFAQR